MGIRIKKMLGYGLTDVSFSKAKYQIVDKRFNKEGVGILDSESSEEVFTLTGYRDWLKSKCEQFEPLKDDDPLKIDGFEYKMELHGVEDFIKENPNFDITYSCFVHDGEFGISKVFCVIPVTHWSRWYRNDDEIDYAESCLRSVRGPVNYRKIIEGGIYPYNGLFCDNRTGERIRDGAIYFRSRKIEKSAREALARVIGFANADDADEHLKPIVPGCVRMICEYCKLFTDPNTLLTLKPMLYVYWS